MSNFKVQMKPKAQISKETGEGRVLFHDSRIWCLSFCILSFDIPLTFEL
jgi:hypothetical protein